MPVVPERIASLLRDHTTLVLASARDSQPWIASVFYAPSVTDDGIRLTCAMLASSRKLATLRENPRAAVYVGPQAPTCWMQAEATAAVVEQPDAVQDALRRLSAHAPAADAFVAQVPVVPVVLTLTAARLTDLTGRTPPVETWPV